MVIPRTQKPQSNVEPQAPCRPRIRSKASFAHPIPAGIPETGDTLRGFKNRRRAVTLLLAFCVLGVLTSPAHGQEAQWIWSPAHDEGHVPHVACHFRRTVHVRSPQQGQVSIVADDNYELYVNGRTGGVRFVQ